MAVTTTTVTVDQNQQLPTILEHPTTVPKESDIEIQEATEDILFDYAQRAQWLRAAVLGANDGLLSTASLMMGMGAVRTDVKSMVLTGIAGLVAGACSMAIGEFVSVYSQYDIEMSQFKREIKTRGNSWQELIDSKKKDLPSPMKAAVASASAFASGAVVPLVASAFVRDYHVRLAVVVAAVSLALIGFGVLSGVLGRAPMVKSTLRVLFGGWLAMALTFGLTKAVGSTGLK